MAHCKHWHNGVCKDCKKNCPIKAKLACKAAKAKLARKAAKVAKVARVEAEKPDLNMDIALPTLPTLEEALAHGVCVALLADKICAALSPLYAIPSPWDRVLHTAARLHDVGWIYGQKGHHKASARMVRKGTVEAVDEDIRPLVALVARYHRQTEPSLKQRRFAELSSRERRGVRRMAAILRLADALDFSHAELVRDVEVVVHDAAVHLILDCPQGCPAEVERVGRKKALFKKVFKKDVVCQCKVQLTPYADVTLSVIMPSAIMPQSCTAEEGTLTAPEQIAQLPQQGTERATEATVEQTPEQGTEQGTDASMGQGTEQQKPAQTPEQPTDRAGKATPPKK